MLSVQKVVGDNINPSGNREVNMQETSISTQRSEEDLKEDRAQQKKQREKQIAKKPLPKRSIAHKSEELIAPLAACRTIRTEAKSWPFENRFWLI